MNAKGWTREFMLCGAAVISILSCACSDHDKHDKDIFTRDQMVKALTEVYLAEQKISRLGIQRDSAEREFNRFRQLVFKKIDVSDSTFKRSFDYYMDRPKEMEIIFTAVVDSLSLMEQRLESSK